MEALKIETVIGKNGELKITGLPYKKGQKVETIILMQNTMDSTKKQAKKKFDAIKINTKGFKFSREEAHER